VGALNLLWPRFWCRFACPVGALLGLSQLVLPWVHRLRPKRFQACDLGASQRHTSACQQCLRCVNMAIPSVPARGTRLGSLVPAGLAILLIALALAAAVQEGSATAPAAALRREPSGDEAGGRAGVAVDVDALRRAFREGLLVEHEAQYYREIP